MTKESIKEIKDVRNKIQDIHNAQHKILQEIINSELSPLLNVCDHLFPDGSRAESSGPMLQCMICSRDIV